ncbi:hypothetical protein FACS189491_08640 [Spirochaetia bacterium]|nr:hypothetical protein FACS189491_08640 [Spirochaetia bacterium]
MRNCMWKQVPYLAVIFLLFSFTACTKDESKSPASEISLEITEGESHGYTLRLGMWLYTLAEDTGAETDAAKAAEALSLGEPLTILDEGSPRKATNTYDNKVYEYTHVRRDTGKEGLVFANQIAAGGQLAVVIDEKANLYKTPKNVDVTDNILPFKTILVIFPETVKDNFVEFSAYDPVKPAYRKGAFIRTGAYSTSDTDVQASILLQTALALDAKEQVRREALLRAALEDYPDSAFATEIQSTLYPGADVATQFSSYDYLYVNANDVNIRQRPHETSPVVGKLTAGTEVHIAEESVQTYTVGGLSDKWFFINEPQTGWVFGAFLSDK